MGRNLHPLTEYVNRRVQEEVVTKRPLLFREWGLNIKGHTSPSELVDVWKLRFQRYMVKIGRGNRG